MIEFALLGCGSFFFVVIAILFLFYLVSIYNGLVTLRNNIDKAWANIDVLLKQRFDMIPNLVETVKGYAKYEKGVFEEITRLRAALVSAEGPGAKAKVNDAMTSSLKSIFAVAENYPKLQANENFLKLQDQLAAMENQIADRREFYNDSVLLYNTRIASLPDSIFAGMMGMKAKEYFKAEESEKGVVQVKLDEEKTKN
jgi:LemA protein